MSFGIQFPPNLAANVGGDITISGLDSLLCLLRKNTTGGQLAVGCECKSKAIQMVKDHRSYLQTADLRELGEKIATLQSKEDQLVQKCRCGRWPWANFKDAKDFRIQAQNLSYDAKRTSEIATTRGFREATGDQEYRDMIMRDLMALISKDTPGAAASSAPAEPEESLPVPAVALDLVANPGTPIGSTFTMSPHLCDDQATPTSSVFPASVMTVDSTTPLIGVPSSVSRSDRKLEDNHDIPKAASRNRTNSIPMKTRQRAN